MSCGRLIAAGPHTAYLEIAESAHRCPARRKLGCRVGVKELGRRSVARGPELILSLTEQGLLAMQYQRVSERRTSVGAFPLRPR